MSDKRRNKRRNKSRNKGRNKSRHEDQKNVCHRNLIIERRSNIINMLCDFFPKDVAKLISNYDYYLEGKIVHTFEGHTDTISCVTILSDGRIVSGSYDKTLKIWNRRTGKCDITFTGHNNWVICVAVHVSVLQKHLADPLIDRVLPDERIVSGSEDNTLKIWNLQTGNCDSTFRGHDSWINCVAVLSDGRIVSGSADETVKIWNHQTGNCDITFRGYKNEVTCIAELLDGRIVSGSGDRTLKIWNPQTGKCDITFTGHTNWVRCVAVPLSVKQKELANPLMGQVPLSVLQKELG
jgi:WD40 repeat protein